MTDSGAGLWKRLPPAPEGHSWTLDFTSVSDGKGNSYEKVNVALLKGRDTVRRGTIDVQLYGYSGAIEWARNALADHEFTEMVRDAIPRVHEPDHGWRDGVYGIIGCRGCGDYTVRGDDAYTLHVSGNPT